MTLIRLLIILAIVWFAWHTVRRWLRGVQPKSKGATQREQKRPLVGGRIVKCRYCDLHLPEQEAVQHDAEWFCSNEHARLFLSQR